MQLENVCLAVPLYLWLNSQPGEGSKDNRNCRTNNYNYICNFRCHALSFFYLITLTLQLSKPFLSLPQHQIPDLEKFQFFIHVYLDNDHRHPCKL